MHKVKRAIYEGFEKRLDAELAFTLAYALGAIRDLSITPEPLHATPTPISVMEAFEEVGEGFLGHKWHVVFQGLKPGVYPSW